MPSLSRTINNKQLTINRKGFTLIELLVVIAIIGILATIIVASFTGAQQRGRDARRKADLDAVKKALELAKADCNGGAYYSQVAGGSPQARYTALAALLDAAPLGYIRNMPNDPTRTGTADDYHYTTSGTAGTDVCLDALGARTQEGQPDFLLRALLENTNDPAAAESATRCGQAVVPANYFVCN